MESILTLVKQLYNENEFIRKNAESELTCIFREVSKLYTGLETIFCENLEKSLRLQYFMFLKSFIMQNYEQSPNYIQKEIQIFLLINFINKVDNQLLPYYSQLVAFLILKSLPNCELIQVIISAETYDSIHIKILTEMLNNLYIKIKIKAPQFMDLSQKMTLFFNLSDLNKLVLLTDLYKSSAKQFYQLSDEIQGIITVQFCVCLTHCPQEYNLLKQFSKALYKITKQKLPSQDVQIMLSDTILRTYINCQKLPDRHFAYRILKLLQLFLPQNIVESGTDVNLILYTYTNLIMLEQEEYQTLCNPQQMLEEDDLESEEDYLLNKIRAFGAEFFSLMITYFKEDVILDKILHLEEFLDANQPIDQLIRKEGGYFILSKVFNCIPAYLFDSLFVQALIMVMQETNQIYIPVKMQVLTLFMKLQAKNLIESHQLHHFITVISENIKISFGNPLYICKIIQTLIYIQNTIQPKRDCISNDTYQDLKQLYKIERKLIYKEEILKQLALIDQLGFGEFWILGRISDEWARGQQLGYSFSFTYQHKMVLNVLHFVIENWTTQQLQSLVLGVFNIVLECLKKKIHEQQSLTILNLLLRKFIQSQQIKCRELEELAKQIQYEFLTFEPEAFSLILQLQYIFLIGEVANQDLTFEFILQHSQKITQFNCLSLLALLFTNLENGYEELILNYYNKILQEMIYDDGKTYSELVCGLAILDIKQYNIKQLLQTIQQSSPNKQIFSIIFSKATKYVMTNNLNYVDYLINLFNSLQKKQDIQFDLDQLTLDNETSSYKQIINVGLSQLMINGRNIADQIIKIFASQFFIQLKICSELTARFKINVSNLNNNSFEFNLQELQLD